MTFSRSKSGSALTRAPRQAWVLEPRMMFDAAAVVTAVDVAAHVAVAATETAPGVDATPVKATVTITDSSGSVEPVDLFNDVRVSADNGGQELKDLVITVNRTGANQAIVIDGTEITLEAANGARTTEGDGKYSYTVAVSGGTTTITVSIESSESEAFEPNDVAKLIDGITYQPLDKTVAGGDVTVTLKSLSDGSDTAELNIHSTITIDSKINVAPVVSVSDAPELAELIIVPGMESPQDVRYSSNGEHAYAIGSDGTLGVFTVGEHGKLTLSQTLSDISALKDVKDITLSADNRSLYAITGNNNIVALSLDENGQAIQVDGSYTRTTPSQNGNITGLAISSDGTQVYATTQWNGMAVFTRDVTTGALTYSQRVNNSGVERSGIVASSGNYVVTIGMGTKHTLSVFQRSETGTLVSVTTLETSGAGYGAVDYQLAISKDQQFIYVADPDNGEISVYQLRDGTEGKTLTRVDTKALENINALYLNADGSQLYALSSEGTLQIYSVNTSTGTLSESGQITNIGDTHGMVLSPDGQSLLVAGEAIQRFSALRTYLYGRELPFADHVTLSDSNLDVLNGGAGNYNGATLTIGRETPSADDQFGLSAGNDLTLQGGKILQAGVEIGTFAQNQGTLSVTFTADVTKETANTVLKQITYRNIGSQSTTETVVLTVTANDGELNSTVTSIALLLTANSAPALVSQGGSNLTLDTRGASVTLFKDTAVNTGEAGQALTKLSIGIDGLNNPHQEYLTVDGTVIDLSKDSTGTTVSGYQYSYTYDAVSGESSLVLSSAQGISSMAMMKLVDGMSYSAGKESTSASGLRTITLTELQDNGGTANGGNDTATLSVSSSINLALNEQPAIEATYSPDAELFYNDGKLSDYNERVSAISVSQDGKTLLITGSEGNNNSGKTYLRVYARDVETGELTLLQSFTQGEQDDPSTPVFEVNGLNTITTLAQSKDGTSVYVAGYAAGGSTSAYSLVQFSRDATTGLLSYVGIVATQGVDGVSGLDAAVSEIVMSDDGTSLYTINGVTPMDGSTGKDAVAFFSRDTTSGALTFVGSLIGSDTLPLKGPSGIVLSSDGKSAYISNLGNHSITVLSRDAETGSLTYVSTINKSTIAADANSAEIPKDDRYLTALQDIAISPDNRFVYVSSNSQGTVSIFSRDSDTGALTYAGTMDLYNSESHVPAALRATSLRDIAISQDGSALYVAALGGQSLLVFARDADSGALTFRNGVGLSVNTINHLAVSADGKNIYAGVSTFFAGLNVFTATANAPYSQTTDIAFAKGVTLSDQELDASDDYKGASITISRNGATSANDHFAFQNGGDLTLSGSDLQYQGETIGTLNVNEGSVSIVFTESVTKAVANQVLHQITYRNDGDAAGASIPLKITLSDGSKDTSLLLTLVENKAPVVDNAEYVPPSAVAGQSYTAELPENLFRDPENGTLTWQVTGLPDGLAFDPATRTISGTPALNGAGAFDVTVTVSDASGESVNHELTLTIAPNPAQVPTIGGESSALEPGQSMEWVYDETISGSVISGVKDTALSADGKYLYVVSSPEGGPAVLSVFVRNAEGDFVLSKAFPQYSDNETAVEHPSLAGASEVILSSDGQYLYVVGSEDNAVTMFRVGSDGELTQVGVLDQADLGGRSLDVRTHIVSQGDYLYLTAAQPDSDNDGRSVLVFKREADGSLTSVSQADNLIGASRLVLDPAGRYLFVSGSGSTVGVTAFSISDQGVLTQAGQLTGTSEYYTNGLAISPDGKTLYAIDAGLDGYTLNTIAVGSNGSLTLESAEPLADDGGDSAEALATGLVVSADGTALFVIGKNITVFSRAEDGSLTFKQTIDSWDNSLGISFSDLQHVELSADGKQLYLIGGDQILVLNVATAGASYTEGDDATVLLPSGRLSDPQLDALNSGEGDYNRASITVGRQTGGLSDDTFGFKADNGLTLDGNNILKDGTTIATFTQVDGVLTVTFTAAVTKADAQNVLRQITYRNTSNNPEHAGSAPAFTFSINDGDNNVATMDVTVNLIGVNDPAELNTTVLNPQIPGNGEFVKLFKDTQIDTVESGQTIWQVILTFDASGPNEAISVGGETIVLEDTNGVKRTASGMEYLVDVVDGKATVTLYVERDGIGPEAMIDSIGYNYLGSNGSGERHVTLSIKENEYSGSSPVTTLEQTITLTLVPATEANTAPVITVPGTTPTYTERADPIVLTPGATVSDAQMDKLNGGKGNYDGATLKVALGDGKTALDKIGFNAGNGLTLSGNTLQKDGVTIGQVTNQDGVLTIRFNADAGTVPTTEDVQNTLRQITYASDSHTPAAQVAVTVTLSDRYLVSQDVALVIGITQINDVPAVNTDPVLSFGDLDRLQTLELSAFGLTGSTNSAVSADGSRVYIADRQGHVALFTRNADGTLTHVRTSAIASGVIQLQITSDGANLYALQRNNSEGIIITFTLDSEGNLTEQSSLKQVWDAAQITLSDDGKNLYLMDRETIIVYGRDTTTGALTRLQTLSSNMSEPPYLWAPTEVVTQGDKVYVVTNPSNGSSLIVYQRNSETGQLTALTYLHSGGTDSTGKVVNLDYVQHLSVSADGQTIFIANSRTSSSTWEGETTVSNHPLKIDAFRLNAAGTLTHVGTINGTATVEDISLSADDKTLYVALSDGSLAYYSADTLERIDAQNNLANAQKIAVSPRGELIILANSLVVLHQTPLSAFYTNGGAAVAAVPTLILSDAELDAANGGAGDYRGASVVFQRSESPSSNDRFEMIAGNGFTVSGNVISKDGQPVATFSQVDGRASVTFTASLSRAEATALVRQIGWRSTVVVNESSVALRVVLNDGEQDSTPYEATVTISDRVVNQAPVGNRDAFAPPAAQVGTRWTYTLPDALFTDPENDALTFTVDDTRLPDGVRFDSATRTLSGTPSTAGSFNLTITATDSAGNATALNVVLTVNAATPVDPGTPTEPVNPDTTTTAAPVILVQQGVSLSVDASEREREQPLGAIVADLSRPEAQVLPTNIVAEPVRQRDADTARPSDAPWVLDPVMSQLMPTLEQVNFSSRASTAVRDSAVASPADSSLFLSVRGQATSLESAFSSVQGALQPDASGALAFSLPQRMFSVREGNATLTLQLANGRPLPAWVQFDARSGVVRITDASAVQVNQIQLALKAQAADGTSRIVPITLQTGQGEGTAMATDRGAMQLPSHPTENRDAERVAPVGKTAFTEQLRQHQPEQDELLAALSELSSLRA